MTPAFARTLFLVQVLAGRDQEAPPDTAEIRKVTEAMRTKVLHVEPPARAHHGGHYPAGAGVGIGIAILEPVVGSSLNRKSSLGHAYAVAGRTGQARRVLTDLRAAAAERYVPAYWFALVHAGLGERDQALRYLERAFEERSTIVAYLLIDPRLAQLRGEPRFVALARRLQGE